LTFFNPRPNANFPEIDLMPLPTRPLAKVADVADRLTQAPLADKGYHQRRSRYMQLRMPDPATPTPPQQWTRLGSRHCSYKGTSGGGLWKFFLGQHDFSIVQVRLIGVAYWEKLVGDELHILGHGQISIYETLFNAIRQKWP
jgi:hypothetical protein